MPLATVPIQSAAIATRLPRKSITWLLRHFGLADAQLQRLAGHARRETLAVYHHVALDGQLEQRYQEAMKKVDL